MAFWPSGEISQSMNSWPRSFFTSGCLTGLTRMTLNWLSSRSKKVHYSITSSARVSRPGKSAADDSLRVSEEEMRRERAQPSINSRVDGLRPSSSTPARILASVEPFRALRIATTPHKKATHRSPITVAVLLRRSATRWDRWRSEKTTAGHQSCRWRWPSGPRTTPANR